MEKLEEALSPEEAAYELQDCSVPPEQRPTLRKLLKEGITAYGEILERLAPFISSKEASAAQQATRRSISALRWSALGLGILALLFKLFQFELHRLQKATRGRFLLPICLGGSLRAILVILENEETIQVPVGESLTGDIAQLGLIATQFRPLESPKGA
ncbi:MAG TPA: hypothetical protein VFR31_20085 [Thermoanaerobaculia bacterium]|nr:hypothetical protein [Thermoanaerobaculia bacterium]